MTHFNANVSSRDLQKVNLILKEFDTITQNIKGFRYNIRKLQEL